MTRSTATLKLEGISLEVVYEYHREIPSTRYEQGEPEHVEISAIEHKGEDIYDLIGQEHIKALEKGCLQWEHEDQLLSLVREAEEQFEEQHA